MFQIYENFLALYVNIIYMIFFKNKLRLTCNLISKICGSGCTFFLWSRMINYWPPVYFISISFWFQNKKKLQSLFVIFQNHQKIRCVFILCLYLILFFALPDGDTLLLIELFLNTCLERKNCEPNRIQHFIEMMLVAAQGVV